MAKTAFIFPGQGSQHIGMGRELYDSLPEVRELYKKASDISGLDLKKLSFDGPQADLDADLPAQLCVYVCNEAWRVWTSNEGIVPGAVTGYSLGFYSALLAAGSVSFEDGLRLVIAAGTHALYQNEKTPGSMAAIIGLSEPEIEEICSGIGDAWMSNINAARQILISGLKDSVNEVVDQSLAKGALHAYVLPMGAAYHTPLMKDASEAFRADIAKVIFQSLRIPLLSYIDAGFIDSPGEIKNVLGRHLHSRVPWKDSVIKLIDDGCDSFIEAGPGSALTRMVKWINRSVKAVSASELWPARVA